MRDKVGTPSVVPLCRKGCKRGRTTSVDRSRSEDSSDEESERKRKFPTTFHQDSNLFYEIDLQQIFIFHIKAKQILKSKEHWLIDWLYFVKMIMFLRVTAIYIYNIIFNVKRKILIDWRGWIEGRKEGGARHQVEGNRFADVWDLQLVCEDSTAHALILKSALMCALVIC